MIGSRFQVQGRSAVMAIPAHAGSHPSLESLREHRCRAAAWVVAPETVELLEALSRARPDATLETLAFRLERPPREVRADLRRLEDLGLLQLARDGGLLPKVRHIGEVVVRLELQRGALGRPRKDRAAPAEPVLGEETETSASS